MPAILFALISFFGWAVGDIYGTVATRKIGSYSTAVWNAIFRLLIFALYIPFALRDLSKLTLNLLIINLVLGLFLIGGAITLYEGLRRSSASLVGTIAASFVAVTVILSLIFLGEKINLNQTFSILIIFVGLLLSTVNIKELSSKAVNSGIIFALLTMILWGIYFAFIKIPVRQIGWFWPEYISFTLFIFVLLLMRLRKIKLEKPTFNNALSSVLGMAFLTGAGDFAFNIGISQGLTSIVAPISGSYPALFVFIAFILFKDKITKQQILGIVTTLVGIVLLSFFSV